MIWFIVNNSYQLHDARAHLVTIKNSGFNVGVFEISHKLDSPNYSDFDKFYSFSAFEYKNFVRCWLNSILIIRLLNRSLKINSEDVLFMYTEFEPFNDLIALQFKKNGGRVYLIEDGGFATYLPFSGAVDEQLTNQERFKEIIIRMCPGLYVLTLRKQNGDILPWLEDRFIDGVCFYRQLTINRKIKVINIKASERSRINTIASTVIFLNEDMYTRDQSTSNYINGLLEIVSSLCSGFSVVYFKYHPRETDSWREYIMKNVLELFPQIIIVDDNAPIEAIIEKYSPEVVASYFSAALLSLHERGVEPLYLYHLIKELNDKHYFQLVSKILNSWDYKFAADFSEVKTGYKSRFNFSDLNKNGLSLSDVVKYG
jgi:hypothetical protein